MQREQQRHVAVFAPAPQLTVTVEDGRGPGDEIHVHAGGQGVWVARMLGALGVPTNLCVSVGGESGTVVRSLLEAEGLWLTPVPVAVVNGAYVHDRRGGDRREIATQPAGALARHDRDDLYTAAVSSGLGADLVVLGGFDPSSEPMPTDDYRRLAADLRTNGTPVVADLAGELRDAVLAGGVDVLKTSDEELVGDGLLRDVDDTDQLAEAMRRLAEEGRIRHVVVTRGDKGTVAWTEGRLVRVVSPHLEVSDSRGAGDSVTAGLTAGLFEGRSFEDALRLGVAAATLNVARRGLATGEAASIHRVLDRVEVEALVER